MNGNPILAQHFGCVSHATPYSSPSSSDEDQYDASTGFSKFGSTSYRKIIQFKPGEASESWKEPKEAEATPSQPYDPDGSSRPHPLNPVPAQSSLFLSQSKKAEVMTATVSDEGSLGTVPPTSGTSTPSRASFSDLMLHSRNVLEDARKICEESKRKSSIQSAKTLSSQPASVSVDPMAGERFREAFTRPAVATPATSVAVISNPSSPQMNSKAIDTTRSYPHSSLSPRQSVSTAHDSAEDPKQVLLFVVQDPASIVARRMSRRQNLQCSSVAEHPWGVSRGQIVERTMPVESQRVRPARTPTPASAFIRRRSEPTPSPSPNENLLSVDSFATILEKLTQFMKAQQQQHHTTASPRVLSPEAARNRVFQRPRPPRAESLSTPIRRRSQTVTPLGQTPSTVRSSTSIQRGTPPSSVSIRRPPRPAAAPPGVPSFAMPTQNWLSKHAKDPKVSVGCYSSGSAGISGTE